MSVNISKEFWDRLFNTVRLMGDAEIKADLANPDGQFADSILQGSLYAEIKKEFAKPDGCIEIK